MQRDPFVTETAPFPLVEAETWQRPDGMTRMHTMIPAPSTTTRAATIPDGKVFLHLIQS